MAGGKAQAFLEAKKTLRVHPDWTDEQVAERIGISKMEIPDVLPAARRDLAADQPESVVRTVIG